MSDSRKRLGLSIDQIEQLTGAARNGPTLFGRANAGAVAWMLTGPERVMLYRLLTEVGVLAKEVLALTPREFRLNDELPHIALGGIAKPKRRGCLLPLGAALASMLGEFLLEHEDEAPVFWLDSVANIEQALQYDASSAGLVSRRVLLSSLASAFATGLKAAAGGRQFWSDGAVEVRP